MDDSDNSWCAVCDRQIVPTRTIVLVQSPNPNPPPSPTHDSGRRSKQGTIRQRSGLVHGTGRVRPNGTIKAPPVKTRVEIDQSPAPLYCSDACRQKDTEFFHGRPVYSDSASSETSSDDTDSLASVSATSYDEPPRKSTPNTRSLAILQREYGMPALPKPTSETYDELAPRKQPAPFRPPEFTSGVMMANRRLEAVLPKTLKPGERAPPLKPVPGWTDGSQAWRASTYSFAPPPRTRADILDPNRTAYESFVATPHRSAGSGVVASGSGSPPSPTASCSSAPSSYANSELLSSFEDSFKRRTSSRLSLFAPSSSPASSSPASSLAASPPRKQRPLAPPAASSMLLVPDVLMRVPRSGGSFESLASLDRTTSSERSARRHSAGAESFPGARSGRVRSPLARASVLSTSEDSLEDEQFEAEDPEEAAYVRSFADQLQPAARSWSYDNVRTYPVMAMPALKERRVVDGVEVEVEVPRPFKKLFTFAPVEVR
ncbi:hypothetical protein FB451DRAFT_1150072 [Mycena latifolia]|nr:hypothetical protein FB451DRAFT_1150072 [Mycena latifolia]